jgi:hypothetical protein
MWLAGIPVAHPCVRELIGRLREAELDPHADHLERTLERGARIVALDENDRHAILRVLEECPDELLELRATLIQEAAWREAEGF